MEHEIQIKNHKLRVSYDLSDTVGVNLSATKKHSYLRVFNNLQLEIDLEINENL
jgi:hypothetical protein